MAYRVPVDGVLHRCEELRARLEAMDRKGVPGRQCPSLEAAVAWESELRRRLDLLAERALDDAPLADTAIVFVVQFER